MDTLVLSTLLIQSLGIVVSVLCLELASCRPRQRATRVWVLADTATTARDITVAQPRATLPDATELPRAA